MPGQNTNLAHARGYSNSNSTFIMLFLCQKTDSKAHHTKKFFLYSSTRDIAGVSTPERAGEEWKIRVDMLFQKGMTSTLT